MRILAIDDNADNLVAIEALLKSCLPGCETQTAHSGPEGIEKAGAFQPDTILLDVRMPEMDGFEACRRLKGDPATCHIPIIFLTAQQGDSQSRARGLEIGGDAFLTKPVETAELTAQVRAMVRIKKAEDALRADRASLEKAVEERSGALIESEKALLAQLDELRRWHEATLGREGRILELKREVNELLAAAGQPPRYESALEGAGGPRTDG